MRLHALSEQREKKMKKDVEQKHKKASGTISACAPKGLRKDEYRPTGTIGACAPKGVRECYINP